MSQAKVEVIVDMYKYAFKTISETLEKAPEDKRMEQVAEGKGHLLWQVGHIVISHDLFINQWILGGESAVPADYTPKFAPSQMGGVAATNNPDDYPSWDQLMTDFNKTCEQTIELLGGISDDDLAGDLKGNVPDQAKAFFGDVGPSLIGMAMHDTHHRGQIGMLMGLLG